jgi:hypothetical protein
MSALDARCSWGGHGLYVMDGFFWPYQAIANFSEEVTNSSNGEVHRIKWCRNFHEAPATT